MNTITLFKTKINVGAYTDFVDTIIKMSKFKFSSYVCFANAHMISTCCKNPAFNRVINDADIVAPDGKPIAVLVGVFNKVKQEKVSGPDIFLKLLEASAMQGKTVFFYGATDAVLKKIVARAHELFPTLRVAGYYAPPFGEVSTAEKEEIIARINSAHPDLTFVALGCPKQERWMAEHVGKIKTCMLGVGQAFQLFAGELKRAPVWMQNAGLEWAFRLWSEPGRLWKRYLYTNAVFLYFTIKYLISTKLKRTEFKSIKNY